MSLNFNDPLVALAFDLATLKADRDAAWRAINTKAPSSKENDWPRFALANSAWETAYKTVHGCYPPPDQVDLESTAYFTRFKNPNRTTETTTPKTDAERDIGNARRRPSQQYAQRQQLQPQPKELQGH